MFDSANSPLWIFAVVVPTAIVFRILAGRADRDRIHKDIESRGGKVLNIAQSFFAPGWFGSGNQRTYDVRYETTDGRIISSTCRTSTLSGVYWRHAPPDD